MPETEKIEEPEEEEIEEPLQVSEPEPVEIPLPEKIKTSNLEDDLGILEKKDNFIELNDTPDDYNWQSGKLVRVEKITYSKENILDDYIETDPGNSFTVYLNKVGFNEATNNENGYVYKDKGAGHFDGDFEHKLTVCITAQDSTALINLWALANMVGDQKAIMDASKRQLNLSIYKAPANPTLRIYERNGASQQNDSFNIEFDEKYYLTIKRDESIGTYGRLYVYVYSNAERTDLLDTLQLDLWDKTDYQYIYATQTYNAESATVSTGYVEDLCLIETQPTKLEFTRFLEWIDIAPDFEAGDVLVCSADTQGITDITPTYTKRKEMKIGRGGTLRIKFDLKGNPDCQIWGRIYRNSTPVGTERTNSVAEWATYSEDISGWKKDDLVQLYIKDATCNMSYWRNFRIYCVSPLQAKTTLDT